MELWKRSIKELKELIEKKEVKPSEVIESFAQRTKDVEVKIKSYVTDLTEQAVERAKQLDEKISDLSEIPELFGIPIAIKDNISTEGIRTTCSSKILENYVPPFDATVIKRLKDKEYVITGKTNLDEFAMGSSTENSAFFVTRNPWDLDRVPGGSSGGSAAAVSAGLAPAALGSDTGGSIRQPAAFCGVIGLKPTYGRVSRYGLVAFASSLDQIGTFTRTVEDTAILLNIISGKDPKDSTSADREVPDFTKFLDKDIKGIKIGIPEEFFVEGLDSQIKELVMESAKLLEKEGAELVSISMPTTKYAIEAYYIIAPSEASSNLARYDGVRYGFRASDYSDLEEMYSKTRDEGFGAEVKRRIMLGTYSLSSGYYDAYYLKAQKVRTLIYQDFMKAFESVDIILTPTTPDVAFRIGEKVDDPLQMYLSDIFTVSVNMAGVPGMSIPCGFKDGLPVGMQLIGKPFDEGTIIQVADRFTKLKDFSKDFPQL
ncbi:MAG TPA: Asp-tRNA(Asn)/Glu-tRNA(Gln) amidotransferase GatCAB subunit A [Persephonella sp.]|uniref:Glutamyl-tRNA(Gln) amidotransferase subunit A n=1 Tax=Persephonella marina (strain DSM 14350 / EX-H1) TaxID=123214 RepID=GATA_PERMH|nr:MULTISPECIES: Asp-tRNA(Asn)/Glu-tRNA(Gln) amidotransferase subunit GatA [Persephonella]C0QRF9.1 RecName: Full=Glutamyl-tRNA(Gln) amidotransferase subunit A; Short=Glu-ADT subunit A [Persephonella marina EX-H1]ACO04690.1 glutamyl-tRNA(Gln) amidotransferase subunit A (Glu-ADTsubunit A) [Persephonella marina EX-H1]HCB69001.1 Asp-tRNA(Asn)/Glu-tRNA(Gln) amidotransferase GatCAB subunit A [Persephonella sp.]